MGKKVGPMNLTKKRTTNAKFYELADGRQQVEISSHPVHYQDDMGDWKKNDTRIQTTDQSGFIYKNDKNPFQSFFGKKFDQLCGASNDQGSDQSSAWTHTGEPSDVSGEWGGKKGPPLE